MQRAAGARESNPVRVRHAPRFVVVSILCESKMLTPVYVRNCHSTAPNAAIVRGLRALDISTTFPKLQAHLHCRAASPGRASDTVVSPAKTSLCQHLRCSSNCSGCPRFASFRRFRNVLKVLGPTALSSSVNLTSFGHCCITRQSESMSASPMLFLERSRRWRFGHSPSPSAKLCTNPGSFPEITSPISLGHSDIAPASSLAP